MIDFLANSANLPFTISLGLMVGIGLLEGVTTLFGFGLSSFLNSFIPEFDLDVDADIDVDLDADLDGPGMDASAVGSASALSKLFGWLMIGRVPILILFVLFLFGFGISGLILQSITQNVRGRPAPGLLAAIPALFIAFAFIRVTGRAFARLIPKDETEAVSEETFIGRTAVITLGQARFGRPTQAKLRDRYGQTHYVMVEPEEDDQVLETGTQILLVNKSGVVFKAVKSTYDDSEGK